ncbi:MAG: leucine-rich repeat domain-containing protein [Ruminococcaceae bacterium]|nr:leucine-rich repeat domain-containing protein [Oscillospiraceae bacterium]
MPMKFCKMLIFVYIIINVGKGVFMKKRIVMIFVCLLTFICAFSSCNSKDCTHEWGEWSVTVQPTCSMKGEQQRKCSLCKVIQIDEVDIIQHNYDKDNIEWDWRGFESATATLSCVMDHSHTKILVADIANEITTAPTCMEKGIKTYTATIKVGDIEYYDLKEESIDALGHIEVIDSAVSATCQKTGLTEGSHCSVCKEVLVLQKVTDKTEHIVEVVPSVAATCSQTGLTAGKKCSACGEILEAQKTTEKIPHTETIIKGVAATCSQTGLTAGKKCSTCGEVLEEQKPIEKISHTETIIKGVAATCSQTGLTAGKKCSACGEVLEAQKIISKLPHTETIIASRKATCAETGQTEGVKCSVCNEIIVAPVILPKTDCQYHSVVTAPVCEAKGYTTHTCTVCNKSYTDSYVNELGHTWGDWEVNEKGTVRNCLNECNCGKYLRILSINASYKGKRLLTGEVVDAEDVVLIAVVSDGTTFQITDFSLENTVMTKDGFNTVKVHCYSFDLTLSVPAIYANLEGAASPNEFEYFEENDSITITNYLGSSGELILPSHINRIPVRYIGEYAFEGCKGIRSLTVPPSIYSINEGAFSECSGLTTLILNEGLQTIGGKAFYGCGITDLIIPDSVTMVEESWGGAFEECKKLKKVVLGNGLTSIEYATFYGCTALESVVMGESVTIIGEQAFDGCISLKSITIGNGVRTIARAAFANCSNLKSINFGTGVQVIEDYAFEKCTSLTSINIPSNVQTIKEGAFSECSGLSTLILNEGLQTIGGKAFYGCGITALIIPDSVTMIEESWGGAFEECKKLKKVVLGNGLTSIEYATFYGCTALESVVIGDSIAIIGEKAFYGCVSLTDVTIGKGVRDIYDCAFEDCSALKTIYIPSNVQNIGEYAFSGCTSLDNIIRG